MLIHKHIFFKIYKGVEKRKFETYRKVISLTNKGVKACGKKCFSIKKAQNSLFNTHKPSQIMRDLLLTTLNKYNRSVKQFKCKR